MKLLWVLMAWILCSCEGYKLKKIGGNRTVAISLPDVKSIFEINKGALSLIHGDVLPGKSSRDATAFPPDLWPGAEIPFEYTSNISVKAIAAAELARQEYKLRTCINFIPRTDEDNYVTYKSLDGCFSHVGVTGGPQVLSLGTGCETMATAIHEMMHACGSWHEQSRADRDDYVEILWENIEPDQIHNFEMLGWKEANPQKLPYNFNSVMHYGATGFGIDGQTTIQTKDSQFASVIGQRSTFSIEDAAKLNRLYGCSEPLLDSYNCNFEQGSICGYVRNQTGSVFSWIRQDLSYRNPQFGIKAPQTDATLGKIGEGSYMVANTPRISQFNSELIMTSMRLSSRSNVQCLQFSYFIGTPSNAALTVRIGSTNEDSSEIFALSENVVKLNKNTDDHWLVKRLTISAPSNYRLVFTARYVSQPFPIIALDDVSVQDRACETDFFMEAEYSTYDNFEVDNYFTSPKMHTEDGYAFRVQVFPAGRQNFTNYVGAYFGLVPGANDANLAWPFCNRYIQLSIVDQNFDPLYAMNRYMSFLTCEDPKYLEHWKRPTKMDTFLGFANLISSDDLHNTRNYLKHDTLVISVLVKDMENFTFDDPTPVVTTSGQLSSLHNVCSILFLSILIFVRSQ